MPMSEYMKTLRAKFGTDLLEVPAVSVIARDHRGRVLLVKHAEGLVWVVPGGAIEPLETPADAAVRETWEETGLHVRPVRIVGVYGGPDFLVKYGNGDKTSYLMVVFEVEVLSGTPQPDGIETLEVSYFTRKELDALTLPAWLPLILQDCSDATELARFQEPSWGPGKNG